MNASIPRIALFLLTVAAPISGMATITAVDDTIYVHKAPVSVKVTANDILGGGATISSLKIATPPTNGTASVLSGNTTILYTPSLNYKGTDNFTYTVTDSTNLTSTATVHVIDAYALYGGQRQGLVSVDATLAHLTTGFVNLVTTQTLSFTAVVSWQGLSYHIKGQFPSNLSYSQALAGSNGASVNINLLATGGPSATITQGSTVATGALQAPISDGKTFVPAQAGAFTARLDVPSDSVAAYALFSNLTGYASIIVRKGGQTTLNGKLPDGTGFSSGGMMDANGNFPVYSGIYGNKVRGSVRGILQISTTGQVSQQLSWTKPLDPKTKFYPVAIEAKINSTGSRYTPASLGIPALPVTPTAGINATLQFQEMISGSITNYTFNVNIDPLNRATIIGPNNLGVHFSIGNPSGIFHGSLRDPVTGHSENFTGLIIQQSLAGSGVYQANQAANRVVLQSLLNQN